MRITKRQLRKIISEAGIIYDSPDDFYAPDVYEALIEKLGPKRFAKALYAALGDADQYGIASFIEEMG